MGRDVRRVLTVEGARNLPPPTEEEIARRRAAFDDVDRANEAILTGWGRGPLTVEEFRSLWEELDPDEDESVERAEANPLR